MNALLPFQRIGADPLHGGGKLKVRGDGLTGGSGNDREWELSVQTAAALSRTLTARCAFCRKRFAARRVTAIYCSATCRSLARYHRNKSVARNDWHTPAHIIALARKVLGQIDLDPASCHEANTVVRAEVFYTPRQNGLRRPWRGKVWLNPPYGRAISQWVDRLVAEVEAGSVAEALALVPARVDTQWFRRLHAFPVCFLTGRLRFSNCPKGAPFPNVVAYFGDSPARFAEVFGPHGAVTVMGKPTTIDRISWEREP